jgi:2'-5' RNA ligase
MGHYRDHHATIFVARGVAGPIEATRRRWDPVMATQIAAHVTLAYPHEVPIVDLFFRRVRESSSRCKPFRLILGGLACFDRPEDGVYVTVDDPEGGYRKLHDELLRPPFQSTARSPHVTLVHPRTSSRGRELWDRGAYEAQRREFTAEEVTITAFDGTKWVVLVTYPLHGRKNVGY